jgi:hypothetical protein
MKSIEEKARAYDEASKWMENVYPTLSHEQQMEAEAFFPMFKESEDEKIRKGLIDFFSEPGRKEYILNGGFTINDITTWLKKQGEMDMESYKTAEDEKREFVGDGFIKCYADFQDFEEGETYWLEYIGNDNYNVRSDNLLGKTYHITPCQLYTIFKKQTWLEKQGEKLTLPKWRYKKDNTPLLRDSLILNKYGCVAKSPAGALISDVWVIDYAELAKLPKEEFEEQGEKKPIVVPKFREGDRIIEKSFDECGCGTIKEIKDGKYIFDDGSFVNIEEQNLWQLVEQKPMDKVESKFKVGDWVVSPNGVYWHIDKISNNRYEVTSNTGESSNWNLDTNIYHKFTIQDAKDGDVLSYRDGQWIFIYKEKIDNNSFYYHALYSTIHQDLTINDSGFTLLGDAIVPATNEERDILMKAMASAGYTFDFEKKELKKTEQKPTKSSDIKSILLVHDEILNNLLERYKTSAAFKTLIVNLQNWWNNTKRHLLSFNIEQKPTEWNEEDIMRIDNIIAIIEGKGYPDYVRWLESLKDKVSPQPKQEWSKEDEEMLLSAIEYVCTFSAYRNSVVDWLKSLKNRVQPQPNPGWSEEDDYNLQCMIAKVTSDIQKGNVGRNNELIDWLKSLRYKTGSQKYWKPSESEIRILEDILNGKINPCNYQEILRNLLEQLKVLRDYE